MIAPVGFFHRYVSGDNTCSDNGGATTIQSTTTSETTTSESTTTGQTTESTQGSTPSTSQSTTGSTTVTTTESSTQSSTSSSLILCENEHGTFHPHESECSKYYVCSIGRGGGLAATNPAEKIFPIKDRKFYPQDLSLPAHLPSL